MKKKLIGLLALLGLIVAGTGAMASSASNKEVDGEVSNAIAFADEHTLIQGSVKDEDKDSSDKSGTFYDLDLLDEENKDYSVGQKYGTKYIVMGTDLFDMKSGEMTDREVADMDYDALKATAKALKGVSRYSVTGASDIKGQTRQLTDRFGDTWYSNKVPMESDKSAFVFFNTEVGVLDLSYKTNISYYDAVALKTVKIDEFGKEKDGYTANLTDIKMIAEDNKNLYFLADVSVTGPGSSGNVKYIIKTGKVAKEGTTVKYPSTIDSYLVSDNEVQDTLFHKLGTLITGAKAFVVHDSKLSAISASGSFVEVTNIELGRKSLKYSSEGSGINLNAGSIGDSDSINTTKYSIASDGKVWVVDKGKVMSFHGDKFSTVFEVDSSMDNLDVYDDNNAIVWGGNSDEFVIREGSSADVEDEESAEDVQDSTEAENDVDAEDATTATTSDKVSYQGHWEFGATKDPKWINAEGKNVANTWVYTNSSWYYVNTAGVASKGWQEISGAWYYFDDNGKMFSGWNQIGGYWYSFGANGAMQTGWKQSDGSWYYLSESHDGYLGREMTGWINQGNDWYLLGSNGVMRTGWVKEAGVWYYFNYQGKMLKDCVVDGYYLGMDGSVQKISERLNKQLNDVRKTETPTNTNTAGTNGNTIIQTSNGNISVPDNTNKPVNSSGSTTTFGATDANGQPIN